MRGRKSRRRSRQNRARIRSERGRALLRKRSELVERAFAHLFETGGLRRVRVRGLEEVRKRVLMQAAAFNLGLLMRRRFGVGTPRSLQGRARGAFPRPATGSEGDFASLTRFWLLQNRFWTLWRALGRVFALRRRAHCLILQITGPAGTVA